MNSPERIPVIAGTGQILQRLDNPHKAVEPLEMMISALRTAGNDCGVPQLLRQADSIYVVRGIWVYGDPAKVIAQRLGAQPSETVGTSFGGNFSHSCVIDAARRIQSGQGKVFLVTGAENGRTMAQAQRLGIHLDTTEAPGSPDRMVAEEKEIVHEAERARGMHNANIMYAIYESAIRSANKETHEAHRTRISKLWEGFSRVAQANPNAWIRKLHSADDIGLASPDNPMTCFPYTRLMNANPRVDMAAGLILCSLETARNAGVPEEKIVYLHSATEANDSQFASTRAELHRSPSMRIAGKRALELAGKTIDEIDHIDLYSCFPSAVQIAATELGIREDRALTVTGGLTFGGGPPNDYVLHAVARMVEVLRGDPGSTGLVSANGGLLASHGFSIYSTSPPNRIFHYENLQDQIDTFPLREAIIDWEGLVTIEAYTVEYKSGQPNIGYVACLLEDGRRAWGLISNLDTLERMTTEEFCGKKGHLNGNGNLKLY